MGFFGVLCCCFRHRGRSYSLDYPYDIPHHAVNEHAKPNDESSKKPASETTQTIKEITPPPAYIPDASPTENIGSSDAHVPDSGSETCRKSSHVENRAIKPLPQREEPKVSVKLSDNEGIIVPYVERPLLEEKKDTARQSGDLQAAPYLGKAVDFPPPPDFSQPYVFVAGNGGLQYPGKNFASSSSSSSAFTTNAFPAPTAVFGLSDSTRATKTSITSATLPIRSSANVPSGTPAPTAVFGLTSSPLPINVPTQSIGTSKQSSNTSTQSTDLPTQSSNPQTQSTTLTIPSSSIAPPPVYPPTATAIAAPPRSTHCPHCSAENKLYRTGPNNPLNAGRQFRKCTSCGSWNGFTDTRGLSPGLYCDCTPPMELRLVAKNQPDHLGRREAFYSCQYKACGVWRNHMDGLDPTLFTGAEIREMMRDGRI